MNDNIAPSDTILGLLDKLRLNIRDGYACHLEYDGYRLRLYAVDSAARQGWVRLDEAKVKA